MTPREQLEPKKSESPEPTGSENLNVIDNEAPRYTADLGTHNERPGSRWEEDEDTFRFEEDGKGRALKGLDGRTLINGLGYFSIGLGVAAILAPKFISRLTGVGEQRSKWVRTVGARELANGWAILSQEKPVESVWSRLGGDVMDLAMLGAAYVSSGSKKGRICATSAAVAGLALLDFVAAQESTRRSKSTSAPGASRVSESIMIDRSAEELYWFWRKFENLPRFMKHLQSVTSYQSDKPNVAASSPSSPQGERSHWRAKGPLGTMVEWDAEITQDRPGEMIAWRSLEGSDVDHMGYVKFMKVRGRQETLVRVKMQYRPVAGVVGANIAKILGSSPDWKIKDDLRRFKQLMETGEIITTEGQPSGRSESTSRLYDSTSRGLKPSSRVRGAGSTI